MGRTVGPEVERFGGHGLDHLTTEYNTIPAGADNTVLIFGYSQGATVASTFKRLHPQDSSDPNLEHPLTDYFFIGNPQRPSGGFFERLAFLGNVPILDAQFGDPSPTDSCDGGDRICTTDLALQYDGVADFPQWLLNPLAVVNAVAGFQYIHGTYLAPDGDDPANATPYGYTPEEVPHAVKRRRQIAAKRLTASTSTAATRSTSHCRRGRCRCMNLCWISDRPLELRF